MPCSSSAPGPTFGLRPRIGSGLLGLCALLFAGCGEGATAPDPLDSLPPGRIAVHAASDLYVVTPGDGSVVQLTATPDVYDRFTWRTTPWSPDGTRLAFTSSASIGEEPTQLWVVAADGSNPVQLTSKSRGVDLPDWSPDGRSLVFVRWVNEENGTDLFVVDAATGEERPLLTRPGWDHEAEWSPVDGRIAYLRTVSGGGYTLRSISEDGTDDRLVHDGHVGRYAWSPDGRSFALSRAATGHPGGYRLEVIGADGANPTLLSPEPGEPDGAYLHSWSPGGNWVAWGAAGRVVLTRADGSESRIVLDLPESVAWLSWSPDGEWLAFQRQPTDAPNELWIVRADGSALQKIDVRGLAVHSAHWSPN